jgi:hypothetical protein
MITFEGQTYALTWSNVIVIKPQDSLIQGMFQEKSTEDIARKPQLAQIHFDSQQKLSQGLNDITAIKEKRKKKQKVASACMTLHTDRIESQQPEPLNSDREQNAVLRGLLMP